MTPTPPPAGLELGQPYFHSRSLFNSNYAYPPTSPQLTRKEEVSFSRMQREFSLSLKVMTLNPDKVN